MLEYNKEIKLSDKLVNGYQYFCDIYHPLSYGRSFVFYHRHIMSIKLGRWISTEENVHHIDGNKINNNLENLMILSRAEHAKLENNIKGNFLEITYCSICDKELKYGSSICRKCYGINIRKFNPEKEELERLVWEMPSTKVAEIYGVSDSAIGKRCRVLGINKPPRGYWAKLYYNK